MIRLTRKFRSQRGTSFLELMIALVITGVVTTAILKAYITQHKHYLVQEDVTDIQQNARAGISELSRHIRMAGNDIPLGLEPIITANTNPDTITLTYRTNDCDTYLAAPMPQPSAELKCGTDISCFYDGQWVYIFEPDSGIGEWFEITHVQAAAFHIQHNTMVLSRKYGADALLLAMTQVKFFIDTSDADHPNMMLQIAGQTPQVYASNISDMQFQYRMKNGTVVDETVIAGDIREVLISITGRSREPDPDEESNPYRQRTFATSVNVRNL